MLQDEQTLRRTVAKNIAAYRKSHKDTQLDLARKLNYSDKSVSKWERGEGLPDVYILAQIAQTLIHSYHPVSTIRQPETGYCSVTCFRL